MIEIIEDILKEYKYCRVEGIQSDKLSFFKHTNKAIANYFLVKCIDCQGFEDDEVTMKRELKILEEEYARRSNSEERSLKRQIIVALDNTKEASQVDKNTSAIYLLKFSDLNKLEKNRNLIYAIEESPNYFKRYVLPYTDNQTKSLRGEINNLEKGKITDLLSDIASNEDEYYRLLEGKNVGSLYELVIRLFAKLPFIQYSPKQSGPPMSAEEEILNRLGNGLENYHSFIQDNSGDLDDSKGKELLDSLLKISDLEVSNDVLDKELDMLLKEIK